MNNAENISQKVEETEGRARTLTGWQLKLVAIIAFSWSLFQLWYASPLPYIVGFGVFIDHPARAIHLGFGLLLAFLIFPFAKRGRKKKVGILDMGIAIVAFYCAFYLFLNYEGIVYRNGILLTTELNIFGHLFKLPVELLIGSVAIIFVKSS